MINFDAVMGFSKMVLKEADEFVEVNRDSVPVSSALIRDLAQAIRDLRKLQYPEMQQLQPIDFGPNDEDRMKDMFEKVFLVEYEISRDKYSVDYSINSANHVATDSAKIYRRWLNQATK